MTYNVFGGTLNLAQPSAIGWMCWRSIFWQFEFASLWSQSYHTEFPFGGFPMVGSQYIVVSWWVEICRNSRFRGQWLSYGHPSVENWPMKKLDRQRLWKQCVLLGADNNGQASRTRPMLRSTANVRPFALHSRSRNQRCTII